MYLDFPQSLCNCNMFQSLDLLFSSLASFSPSSGLSIAFFSYPLLFSDAEVAWRAINDWRPASQSLIVRHTTSASEKNLWVMCFTEVSKHTPLTAGPHDPFYCDMYPSSAGYHLIVVDGVYQVCQAKGQQPLPWLGHDLGEFIFDQNLLFALIADGPLLVDFLLFFH